VVWLAGVALTVGAWADLEPADSYTNFGGAVAAIVYATLGALVVRRAGNRVGWIMLLEGLGFAIVCAASGYAIVGITSHPGLLPGPKIVGALAEWSFVPSATGLAFMLLVFPTGALPSRRWR